MAELTKTAEATRLRTLASYAILDTPPEVDLDNLTRLAADICETPIAIISLVDATRQWFKARIGIDAAEMPREIAFCAHALSSPQLLEVEDAAIDPRFAQNPLVTGELALRFYASAPLVAHDGCILGTLGVIDRRPRRLTEAQKRALQVLSQQVMQQFELRRQLALRADIERQLQARLRQQATIAVLGLKGASDTDLDKLLPASLHAIADTLDIEYSALLQLTPDHQAFAVIAGFGWPGPGATSQLLSADATQQPGYTLGIDMPVYVPDYNEEQRFTIHPGLLPNGIVSGISVPITLHNAPWGVLTAHSRKQRGFSADDTHFLQAAATLLATTIDRLTTQKLLRESEHNMRIAQQIAHVGNWEVALSSGNFAWSDELYRIFGLDPTAPVLGGEQFYERVHPADRAALRQYVAELRNGKVLEIEYRIVRPSGEVRHLRERGSALQTGAGDQRLFGTVVDLTEIKQANLALAENTALLEIASSAALLGGWKLDLQEPRLTWSDAVRRIHGMPEDYEPSLENSLLAYVPEYRSSVRAAVSACVAEGIPFDIEAELINAQQTRVWVRAIGRPQRDADGNITAIQGGFQDISERKKTEAQINRLAAQLETTLENITDAFFTVDHAWRFTYLNKRAEQLVQRRREDLLGKSLDAEFEGLRETRIFDEYQRALNTGETVTFVEYYPPLDSWFDVTAYPTPDGLAVYFRKVNDRILQERQLRQQALLLDQAKDAILVRDLDHRILFWNKAAERVYGWKKNEAVGQSVENLLYAHSSIQFRAATQEVLDRGEWSGRLQQWRRDGAAITIEGHWTLVRDDDGAPQAVLAINSDISERLELEKRLAQSQKLESIGQLTGGIAHDFNNLLTVIIGNIELLAEELGENDPNAPIIELISTAADRGAELTGRLLSFARRQTLEPRVVSPQQIVDDLAPLLRRALGEAIEIELFHEPDLWAAVIDPAQLESALLNLCINARDAMPDGGKLTIETANVVLDGSYVAQHPEATSGRYVQVVVTDNGSGIDAANLPQVFDPFFTTKEKGKGTGLGLSMVYGFVKQSGGHIKIYSEPGHGTAVHIYFPEGHGEIAPPLRPPVASQQARGSEHILLVEDDELVRNHAARLLRGLGYEVSLAANGIAALALIRQGQPFDLLFTDVIMPGGLNGPQLAAEARKRLPNLPVLYTSGYTENAVVRHGQAEAGILLLHKPYRRQVLAEKVRQALQADPAGVNRERDN